MFFRKTVKIFAVFPKSRCGFAGFAEILRLFFENGAEKIVFSRKMPNFVYWTFVSNFCPKQLFFEAAFRPKQLSGRKCVSGGQGMSRHVRYASRLGKRCTNEECAVKSVRGGMGHDNEGRHASISPRYRPTESTEPTAEYGKIGRDDFVWKIVLSLS